MKKKIKKFVYENFEIIDRIRISENRDLVSGIRLNRNERVQDFKQNILSNIFSTVKKYDLGKYPDQSKIYYELSKFLKIDKKFLLLSSGIDGSLKTIFEIFLKPKDKIACLSPTYAMYEVYSRIYKINFLPIKYNFNYTIDKKDLIKKIKSGIKILFLPNPNQPIEDNLDIKELNKICLICKKNKVLLVIDEAYYMFGSSSGISLLSKFPNLIILRTLSKAFGLPSIRLGYIIASENIIKILNTYRLSYESNFLTDFVAGYFLKNKKKVYDYINKVIIGRNFIKSELKKLGLKVIGGKSNFLLVIFENNITYLRVMDILMKKKIYVKGNYKGILENSILFTCGPKNYMQKLLRCIKKAI